MFAVLQLFSGEPVASCKTQAVIGRNSYSYLSAASRVWRACLTSLESVHVFVLFCFLFKKLGTNM